MRNLTLLTDLYQLTMLAGYFEAQKHEEPCCFELYFRRLPFAGGYCIAAGLEPALDYLQSLRFHPEEVNYLRSLGLFTEKFLDWLPSLSFRGEAWAVSEGELVFPNVPLLRLQGSLGECQVVESALLNIMNFQTLVASKASRVKQAAGPGSVLEFGLRRAQGIDGALSASRAAFVGGCEATSNVLAGSIYQIPVKGTHAHSWVMAFSDELEAFRAYARSFPDTCTLLVDTYDTLASGVPHAVIVGKELAAQGHHLAGIRLDSGDLCELSRQARRLLDEGGLTYTKIVASNDLDEYEIGRLQAQGAAIDIWGVGTNLVTCKDEPALGGVYKLVASGPEMTPRIKISSNLSKSTIPGIKQVYRGYDPDGMVCGDLLALAGEPAPQAGRISCYETHGDKALPALKADRVRPLLQKVMEGGQPLVDRPTLLEIQELARRSVSTLPEPLKALTEPAPYQVGLSQNLSDLRGRLIRNESPL